jgi:glucosylceramidase
VPNPKEQDPGLPFPITILSDPKAEKYVDEVTFDGYSGQLSGMTKMHFEFPTHGVYFSEGSFIGINGGSCSNT